MTPKTNPPTPADIAEAAEADNLTAAIYRTHQDEFDIEGFWLERRDRLATIVFDAAQGKMRTSVVWSAIDRQMQKLRASLSASPPAPEAQRETAMQELASQAQELDMGYPAPAVVQDGDVREVIKQIFMTEGGILGPAVAADRIISVFIAPLLAENARLRELEREKADEHNTNLVLRVRAEERADRAEAELAQLRAGDVDYQARANAVKAAQARTDRAEADANRLAEALRPFAHLRQLWVDGEMLPPHSWNELDRAAAALAEHDKATKRDESASG